MDELIKNGLDEEMKKDSLETFKKMINEIIS